MNGNLKYFCTFKQLMGLGCHITLAGEVDMKTIAALNNAVRGNSLS